jgi:hypothetical protein
VAETEDLEKYFHLYSQLDKRAPAPVRSVVMEMMLEAASNGSLSALELQQVWPRIEALLYQDADTLATTASYWCCWDADEHNLEEEGFRVSPYMREWWRVHYPIPSK